MTLASSTSRVSYAGNGVTTNFSFPYYFILEADLTVIVKDDVTLVETTKVLNTHYTVTGEGNQAGGTVIFGTAPAANTTVSIFRDPQVVQETDLVENDKLPAESVEQTLDKLTMVAQRHADLLTRAIRLTDGVPTADFDPELPEDLAGTADVVLITNPTGDGFIVGPTATDIANAQTNAAAAAASAAAAAASASSASTSATQAASSVASVFGQDVVFKTFADSPVTILDADKGKIFVFDATGGNIAVTMPQISTLTFTDPWTIGVKKTDASLNTITFTRAGTDTFEAAATTLVLSSQNEGKFLVPDTDPAPDLWTALDMSTTTAVATTAKVTAVWDFIIGSGAQVTSGAATHSTWASAIAAASAGDTIKVLEGSWTENVTVDKQLHIEGNGYGSYLNGSLTFNSSSDRSYVSLIRLADNVTLNSGADLIKVESVWLASGKTFIDNGTGNLVEGFQET